ncbi:MAG: peptidoglycan DD-metalloendopeptidase family protein [Frisingicoccus sp.]
MKENFKNYWKKNGFYMVLTGALVVVLGISGVAGYRSGMKDKAAAENAAEFSQAENAPEVLDETPAVAVGNTSDIENAVAESIAAAEAANATVAETFGDDAKMVWPVEGEILKEFSADKTIYFETLDQYKCNPALFIKADVNQRLLQPWRHRVNYRRSVNGTVLTVDMGNGYKAIYGQMKDINTKEGEAVVKGQAIGNVAQPTKYYTEEGSHLYFGLTKDDTPVNPQDYLEK